MHGVRALQLAFSANAGWGSWDMFQKKTKASTLFEVVSGHCKNKGNDHRLRKFLIVKQILVVSSIGNAKRSGAKG